MSEPIQHFGADIIRHVLIDMDLGTHPDNGLAWPIYARREPDKPDNCITIYDTVGTHDGRIQVTGEVLRHLAFMLRVRASLVENGGPKIEFIVKSINEELYNRSVTLDPYGAAGADSTTYMVHSCKQTGQINYLGQDQQNANRELFTANYLYTLTQL